MTSERRVDDLERRIAQVCGHLNVMHGQLVDLVVETVATNGWHGVGFRSAEHWVSLRTGLSPARAQQLVQLARRADELPVTMQALRSGRLSIDQAVVVAQTVPAHNDREACDLALVASVSQLRHALRKYAFAPDPAANPAQPTHPADPASSPVDPPVDPDGSPAPDSNQNGDAGSRPVIAPLDPWLVAGNLSFFFDEHGRFQLHLDAPLDDGLIIESALTEARDALFRSGHTNVTWMDAFNEICRRSLASNDITGIGTARSDRYRIYVHLDTEGAWVNSNIRVPQALLDEIICDGVIRPVWTVGGKPVNVGRATKVISPELRRLVLHRDGHRCRTPGCDNTLGLQIHHIQWFDRDDGLTETDNLTPACSTCHHHIHRGNINVTGNADETDGLTYTDRHGHNLIRHPVPIPPAGPPPSPQQPFRHPTGEHLDHDSLWFTPPFSRPPPSTTAPPTTESATDTRPTPSTAAPPDSAAA